MKYFHSFNYFGIYHPYRSLYWLLVILMIVGLQCLEAYSINIRFTLSDEDSIDSILCKIQKIFLLNTMRISLEYSLMFIIDIEIAYYETIISGVLLKNILKSEKHFKDIETEFYISEGVVAMARTIRSNLAIIRFTSRFVINFWNLFTKLNDKNAKILIIVSLVAVNFIEFLFITDLRNKIKRIYKVAAKQAEVYIEGIKQINIIRFYQPTPFKRNYGKSNEIIMDHFDGENVENIERTAPFPEIDQDETRRRTTSEIEIVTNNNIEKRYNPIENIDNNIKEWEESHFDFERSIKLYKAIYEIIVIFIKLGLMLKYSKSGNQSMWENLNVVSADIFSISDSIIKLVNDIGETVITASVLDKYFNLKRANKEEVYDFECFSMKVKKQNLIVEKYEREEESEGEIESIVDIELRFINDVVNDTDWDLTNMESRDSEDDYLKIENPSELIEKDVENISIDLKKGEKVIIYGENGTGKSTILKNIMGIMEYDGTIEIDGRNIKELDISNLITYVPQETYLYSGSIMNNIGDVPSKVYQISRLFGTHDTIMNFPYGYNTQVGELGQVLNGGLRQKIFYMRAFLKNTPIYILDEPTNNLDKASIQLFGRILRKMKKTVLCISHSKDLIVQFGKKYKFINEDSSYKEPLAV